MTLYFFVSYLELINQNNLVSRLEILEHKAVFDFPYVTIYIVQFLYLNIYFIMEVRISLYDILCSLYFYLPVSLSLSLITGMKITCIMGVFNLW
mgnify:CR=1 FL=1|jgi:hypothetical protein